MRTLKCSTLILSICVDYMRADPMVLGVPLGVQSQGVRDVLDVVRPVPWRVL